MVKEATVLTDRLVSGEHFLGIVKRAGYNGRPIDYPSAFERIRFPLVSKDHEHAVAVGVDGQISTVVKDGQRIADIIGEPISLNADDDLTHILLVTQKRGIVDRTQLAHLISGGTRRTLAAGEKIKLLRQKPDFSKFILYVAGVSNSDFMNSMSAVRTYNLDGKLERNLTIRGKQLFPEILEIDENFEQIFWSASKGGTAEPSVLFHNELDIAKYGRIDSLNVSSDFSRYVALLSESKCKEVKFVVNDRVYKFKNSHVTYFGCDEDVRLCAMLVESNVTNSKTELIIARPGLDFARIPFGLFKSYTPMTDHVEVVYLRGGHERSITIPRTTDN